VANLQPALEQCDRKTTPCAGILFFRVNLLYASNIDMCKRVKSRCVHYFKTCEKNSAAQTAAQWRLLTNFAINRVFEWDNVYFTCVSTCVYTTHTCVSPSVSSPVCVFFLLCVLFLFGGLRSKGTSIIMYGLGRRRSGLKNSVNSIL